MDIHFVHLVPFFFSNPIVETERIDQQITLPLGDRGSYIPSKEVSNHNQYATSHLIEATFDKIQRESTWIEAQDLPPLITINQLHDLFCIYGQPISGNLKKELCQRHIFLKFDDPFAADKSLYCSGMQFGDKPLNVKKWLELASIEKAKNMLKGNPISMTHQFQHPNKNINKHSSSQNLEPLKINWRFQCSLLERFVSTSLHSESKLKSPLNEINNHFRRGEVNNTAFNKNGKNEDMKRRRISETDNYTTIDEWNLL